MDIRWTFYIDPHHARAHVHTHAQHTHTPTRNTPTPHPIPNTARIMVTGTYTNFNKHRQGVGLERDCRSSVQKSVAETRVSCHPALLPTIAPLKRERLDVRHTREPPCARAYVRACVHEGE